MPVEKPLGSFSLNCYKFNAIAGSDFFVFTERLANKMLKT